MDAQTNHQIVFPRHGPTSGLHMVETPLSAGVEAGHVRIRVRARPINPADVLFVQGHYDSLTGDMLASSHEQVAGSELSGEVVALGPGVEGPAVGTRVYASTNFPATRSWAEFADVAASAVVPLPDGVDWVSGSQLLVNPLTAIGFLETLRTHNLAPNDWFVLTAANSALCRMMLQLARLRGVPYRSLCIVRSASARQELLDLGASAVLALDEVAGPALDSAIRAIVPEGIKVTFDALGGGPVTVALINLLAKGGTHYVYGMLAGQTSLPLDTARLCFKATSVSGWYLGVFLGKNYQNIPSYFKEVLGYLDSKALVFVSKEFDFLTQWKQAVEYAEEGSKQGKAVLVSK